MFWNVLSHKGIGPYIQEHHVTEKKEEHPIAMNAFELISMPKGLNLEHLFDVEQVHNFTRCFEIMF